MRRLRKVRGAFRSKLEIRENLMSRAGAGARNLLDFVFGGASKLIPGVAVGGGAMLVLGLVALYFITKGK